MRAGKPITCGSGHRIRSRVLTKCPADLGVLPVHKVACNLPPCTPSPTPAPTCRPCQFKWNGWSKCSLKCSVKGANNETHIGHQTRTAKVTQNPDSCGIKCPEAQTRKCKPKPSPCPGCPKLVKWSLWSECKGWTVVKQGGKDVCKTATQYREAQYASYPVGKHCPRKETRSCGAPPPKDCPLTSPPTPSPTPSPTPVPITPPPATPPPMVVPPCVVSPPSITVITTVHIGSGKGAPPVPPSPGSVGCVPQPQPCAVQQPCSTPAVAAKPVAVRASTKGGDINTEINSPIKASIPARLTSKTSAVYVPATGAKVNSKILQAEIKGVRSARNGGSKSSFSFKNFIKGNMGKPAPASHQSFQSIARAIEKRLQKAQKKAKQAKH